MMMEQLLAHLVGDYILQSDWIAKNKYTNNLVAVLHGMLYTLPFLFLTRDIAALSMIFVSHVYIDRMQIAKYVCWTRNRMLSPEHPPPFSECDRNGADPSRPVHITDWLCIIVDNTLHLLINYWALQP